MELSCHVFQGDPVMDALRKHCVDDPTQFSYRRAHRSATGQVSIPSLLELVAAGDFRAAIDVTGKLLKTFGQGMGKAHQPSRNTEESLKVSFSVCVGVQSNFGLQRVV